MNVDGEERLVGVTSYSDGLGDNFMRVDAYYTDFIAPFLDGDVPAPPLPPTPPPPSCQFPCADFGYTPGYCQDGWRCTGTCIEWLGRCN
jgi:hypothetical protein